MAEEKKRRGRQVHQTSITLYPGDRELIAYGMDFLGMQLQGEYIRSAVRAYTMHLQSIAKKH